MKRKIVLLLFIFLLIAGCDLFAPKIGNGQFELLLIKNQQEYKISGECTRAEFIFLFDFAEKCNNSRNTSSLSGNFKLEDVVFKELKFFPGIEEAESNVKNNNF